MLIKTIQAKSILSPSKIYPYVINPYSGCQHGCSYCYARFMKKFTGHTEPWGEFVDVKINAPQLLAREILKKKKDTVWISGVCDPYQPLEAEYRLTRACLEILAANDWPAAIQTRSPLILRDLDVLKQFRQLEAGFSIPTADDEIRKIFEPNAPSVPDRIDALRQLHEAGIKTYAMIAPMLPGAEKLPQLLAGNVDRLLVDRMNYGYADWVYRKHKLEDAQSEDFARRTGRVIAQQARQLGIPCRLVY